MPTWTSPATYTVGQTLGAATLNTQLRDNTSFLYQGLQSRVYNNANMGIADNTWAALPFNTNNFDTAQSRGYANKIHDPGVVAGRFTAPVSGYWMIGCTVEWDNDNVGARGIRGIHSNGGVTTCQSYVASVGGQTTVSASTLVHLAATEYIVWEAFQNSGGNLDILYIGDLSPVAWMCFNGGA